MALEFVKNVAAFSDVAGFLLFFWIHVYSLKHSKRTEALISITFRPSDYSTRSERLFIHRSESFSASET